MNVVERASVLTPGGSRYDLNLFKFGGIQTLRPKLSTRLSKIAQLLSLEEHLGT